MPSYRVISSDNHVIEPPDLWTSRIEPQYRDRCPQLVVVEGGQVWICDGRRGNNPAQGAQVGVRFEDSTQLTRLDSFDNVRPGGYIPEEHLKDMDADGVDVSLLYPSAGLRLFGTVPDGDLLSAVFRAYNDYVAAFFSADPKRLGGIAMINVDDVSTAVKEMARCRHMGFVGAMITVYPPEGQRYDAPMYEPLWAAAQDLAMPLSLHAATNRYGSGEAFQLGDTARLAHLCNMDMGVRMSLADLIYSGVFERYPKLQVGAVEHELSWVPHFLDRLDYNYNQRSAGIVGYRFKANMLPSDYFRRNVFLGFQEDALGIQLRDYIGVDTLQWGSDYPHQESTFPRTREILEKILSECTEDEKAKIVGGNAARVYDL